MYAFGSVTVTWGSHICTGLVPGTPVIFKRNTPRVTTSPAGSDGKAVDVASSDNTGTCELTFQQSSPSVAYFNAQAKLYTRQPLVIRDMNGTEIDRAMMRCMGEADSSYGDSLGERKFTLTSNNVAIEGGGGHEA